MFTNCIFNWLIKNSPFNWLLVILPLELLPKHFQHTMVTIHLLYWVILPLFTCYILLLTGSTAPSTGYHFRDVG